MERLAQTFGSVQFLPAVFEFLERGALARNGSLGPIARAGRMFDARDIVCLEWLVVSAPLPEVVCESLERTAGGGNLCENKRRQQH